MSNDKKQSNNTDDHTETPRNRQILIINDQQITDETTEEIPTIVSNTYPHPAHQKHARYLCIGQKLLELQR